MSMHIDLTSVKLDSTHLPTFTPEGALVLTGEGSIDKESGVRVLNLATNQFRSVCNHCFLSEAEKVAKLDCLRSNLQFLVRSPYGKYNESCYFFSPNKISLQGYQGLLDASDRRSAIEKQPMGTLGALPLEIFTKVMKCLPLTEQTQMRELNRGYRRMADYSVDPVKNGFDVHCAGVARQMELAPRTTTVINFYTLLSLDSQCYSGRVIKHEGGERIISLGKSWSTAPSSYRVKVPYQEINGDHAPGFSNMYSQEAIVIAPTGEAKIEDPNQLLTDLEKLAIRTVVRNAANPS
jgi:hypothetical protein